MLSHELRAHTRSISIVRTRACRNTLRARVALVTSLDEIGTTMVLYSNHGNWDTWKRGKLTDDDASSAPRKHQGAKGGRTENVRLRR